ncbi:uncharacterized protein SOCEGT47_085090 [Sorangium cellulosum]|uniref:Cupin 2 conserved barrel domain-containing protein n=1 Tax=Sorangium cellulosum TaxID=56 RepID=A0A4P2QDY5_SORCE|nr:hypothetical protein [Sorangium cellulosum]AUX27909.1 uncharacterized protein SOCEGT47_085090 [Sorangium cellulosum]
MITTMAHRYRAGVFLVACAASAAACAGAPPPAADCASAGEARAAHHAHGAKGHDEHAHGAKAHDEHAHGAKAHDEHAHDEHAPQAPAGGARVDRLAIPREAGPGEPREVKVILDNPFMKVVVITLRAGTVLPTHTAPSPVTIQAIAGAGTVRSSGGEARIDREHLVALSPGAPHEVAPDPGTDLVLLVQHMRGAPAR